MTAMPGFTKAALARWAHHHLRSGSHVVSDGLACFRGVADAGCTHTPLITGGGSASMRVEALTWVNTVLGNVKNSLHGTYHAIRARHVPRYLAECCYRFNRRFRLERMIPRLAWTALRTPPMPQRLLSLAEAQG